MQTVRKGEQLDLRCEAFGEKPIAITWSKDRIPFDPAIELRYNAIKDDTRDGVSALLRIVNVDRRDNSVFTCTAGNPYGKDTSDVQVIVQGKKSEEKERRNAVRSIASEKKRN